MALLMSVKSSSGERVIWPEPEGKGSLDILVGEGGKVLAEEVEERRGEFVSVIKFDMTGTMSEH